MQRASFKEPKILTTSIMGVLLGLGFALYAYRFSVGGANITLLRIATLILGTNVLWTFAQSIIKQTPAYWSLAFGVGVLALMNIYWYSSLDNYPIPQREIISHIANLALLLGIVVWMQSERQLIQVMNGYLLAAVIAIAIGYYGMAFHKIPFENILRAYGSETAERLSYINDDGELLRLSGPFVDPNFFGIYLFTVFVYALWMFHYYSRSKFYAWLAVASLVTVVLTVSRTAMVGLAMFIPIYLLWLPRNTRNFILIGAFIMAILGIAALLVTSGSFSERMLSSESLVERMEFITRGIDAFAASPIWGSGPASIVDDATGIATAHMMYLSILAKFGLLGAIPYFTFVFYPLLKVILQKRIFKQEYCYLIIGLYLPIFLMFFLYDFLYFLEFQYLIYAIGYSVVFSSYSRIGQTQLNDAQRSLTNNLGSTQ